MYHDRGHDNLFGFYNASCENDSTLLSKTQNEEPGEVLGTRENAILVKSRDGAVWFTHMKAFPNCKHLKVKLIRYIYMWKVRFTKRPFFNLHESSRQIRLFTVTRKSRANFAQICPCISVPTHRKKYGRGKCAASPIFTSTSWTVPVQLSNLEDWKLPWKN